MAMTKPVVGELEIDRDRQRCCRRVLGSMELVYCPEMAVAEGRATFLRRLMARFVDD